MNWLTLLTERQISIYYINTENDKEKKSATFQRKTHNFYKNVFLFSQQETKEDIKDVIANVSQLKYELQTNKELIPLDGDGSVYL